MTSENNYETKNWYSHRMVQYEILNGTKGREVAVMKEGPKAMLRPFAVCTECSLKGLLEFTNILNEPCSIYASIAKVELPQLKWDSKMAGLKEARDKLKANWDRRVKGYDFVMDFDVQVQSDMNLCFADVAIVVNEFTGRGVPFTVMYSGSKGFHLRIAQEHLPVKIKRDIQTHKDFALSLVSSLGLTTITTKLKKGIKQEPRFLDMSCYDKRRVLRVPYTINPRSGKPQVALPLTVSEFMKSPRIDFTPNAVLKQFRIFKRGIPETAGNAEAVKRLLRDLKVSF